MIVVLKKKATEKDIDVVAKRIEKMGLIILLFPIGYTFLK